MSSADIKRLGMILSVQAGIDGMKAENKQQELSYGGVAYDQKYFEEKAIELKNIVSMHNDQIEGLLN